MVSAANQRGEFVAVQEISRAATISGLTRSDIIGKRLWEFCPPESAKIAEECFSRCIVRGESQKYEVESVIAGRKERWECALIPAHGAEVLAIGREILNRDQIHLNEDEQRAIRLLSDDLTVEEIADHCGCPAATVATRLKRAREKCGCHTNHGLLAFALRFGLM